GRRPLRHLLPRSLSLGARHGPPPPRCDGAEHRPDLGPGRPRRRRRGPAAPAAPESAGAPQSGQPLLTVAAALQLVHAPSARAMGAPVSRELDRIILKALAHSLEERYPTATHLHADLSRQARAEGVLADPVRVARYVRSLFPEAAAEEAASREEHLDMADNKGGSDLDVFEGLAKKATRPTVPGLTPPPPSQVRKPTLLGGVGPLPPPATPPG